MKKFFLNTKSKICLLGFLIFIFLFPIVVSAQQPSNYQNINMRYRWIAGKFDSTLHIPSGVVPSVRGGGWPWSGALFMDTVNHILYYRSGGQWRNSATGGSFVDSIYERNDSLFYIKSSSEYFVAKVDASVDTTLLSTRAWRQKGDDSLGVLIGAKLGISDTASMLSNYLRGATAGWGITISGAQHKTWSVDTGLVATQYDLLSHIDDDQSWISDWRRNNYQLVSALNLNYRTENKQTFTLGTGESDLHGFIFAKGKLWASDMLSPNNVYRFNNPDDLSDYDVLQIGLSDDWDSGYDIIYVKQKDRLYTMTTDNGGGGNSRIYEIDPVSFTKTLRVDFAASYFGFTSLATDGEYLYALRSNGNILKINLFDFSYTNALTLSSAVFPQCLRYDGTHLFATDVNTGRVWKIRPSDMTELATSDVITSGGITDDIALVGDNLWVGAENTEGNIYVIKKSDLSLSTTIATGVTAVCYATFFDGKYVWALFNTSPGTLVRIDPETNVIYKTLLATGENAPNEMATDGQRLFVSLYTSPAKIVRLAVPSLEHVSGGGGSGITVGSTTISGGTDKAVPFNDGGVYQEDAASFFYNKATRRLTVGENTTNDGAITINTKAGVSDAFTISVGSNYLTVETYSSTFSLTTSGYGLALTGGNGLTLSGNGTSHGITFKSQSSTVAEWNISNTYPLNFSDYATRFQGAATFSKAITIAEVAAPSTPALGFGALYAKSDGKIYFKNDDGTEYDLTSSGGGGGLGDPGSNGIVVRTDINTTTARSIAGTSGKITVTNGDGVSGNPTIDVGADIVQTTQANTYGAGNKQSFDANATNADIRLIGHAGDPSSLSAGDVWYNSTDNVFKARFGSTTRQFATLDGTETLSNKTLTAPRIASGGFIADANGNEQIIFTTTTSAVNEFTVANAATGNNPRLSATGDDSNVGIDFEVKGTGAYRFRATTSGPTDLRLFEDADNGTNYVSLKPAESLSADATLTLPSVTSTVTSYKESSESSNSTPAPTGDAKENWHFITAQAAAATFSAPSGTAANGNTLWIRIKDNGTARSLSWNTAYRAGTNLALPTTTTAGKTMYIRFVYNSADSKWDLVAVLDGL